MSKNENLEDPVEWLFQNCSHQAIPPAVLDREHNLIKARNHYRLVLAELHLLQSFAARILSECSYLKLAMDGKPDEHKKT